MNNTTKTYLLNHWIFNNDGQGISLEGHLHGRPEFPDGIAIRTSYIEEASGLGNDLFVMTQSSYYRCPVAGYRGTGRSLIFSEGILTGADRFRELALAEEKRKEEYCRSVFKKYSPKESVLYAVNGCHNPYTEWIASYCRGQLNIEKECLQRNQLVTGMIRDSSSFSPILCEANYNDDIRYGAEYADIQNILIENTGNTTLRILAGGPEFLVEPGEIREIRKG